MNSLLTFFCPQDDRWRNTPIHPLIRFPVDAVNYPIFPGQKDIPEPDYNDPVDLAQACSQRIITFKNWIREYNTQAICLQNMGKNLLNDFSFWKTFFDNLHTSSRDIFILDSEYNLTWEEYNERRKDKVWLNSVWIGQENMSWAMKEKIAKEIGYGFDDTDFWNNPFLSLFLPGTMQQYGCALKALSHKIGSNYGLHTRFIDIVDGRPDVARICNGYMPLKSEAPIFYNIHPSRIIPNLERYSDLTHWEANLQYLNKYDTPWIQLPHQATSYGRVMSVEDFKFLYRCIKARCLITVGWGEITDDLYEAIK